MKPRDAAKQGHSPPQDGRLKAGLRLSVIANILALFSVVVTVFVAADIAELNRTRGYVGIAPLSYVCPMGLWLLSLPLMVIALVLCCISQAPKKAKKPLRNWLIVWLVQTVLMLLIGATNS